MNPHMHLLLYAIITLSSSVADDFVRPSECTEPEDWGTTPCSSESSIRYYYDTEKNTCLAFLHSGCGGTGNNFETSAACANKCYSPNRKSCPGATAPTLNTEGQSYPCGHIGNKEGKPTCVGAEPQIKEGDNFCHTGVKGGLCCTVESKLRYHLDFRKLECPEGREKYSPKYPDSSPQGFYYGPPPLGRNCERNFCPDGYECTMGEYYSYCCK